MATKTRYRRGTSFAPPSDDTMLHRLREMRRNVIKVADATNRTIPTSSKQAAQENAATLTWAIDRIEGSG